MTSAQEESLTNKSHCGDGIIGENDSNFAAPWLLANVFRDQSFGYLESSQKYVV